MFRFLPRRLSVLLAEYLVLVRPVEIFLSRKFNCKGADDLDEFLWADYKKGVWSGEFLSDQLKIHTTSYGMHGLGFREYRQVAVAFMERHMKYKVDESRWNMNSILDLQAGHKSRTAGRDYATATGDLREVTREAMHLYYLASCEWHDLMLKRSKGAITVIPNMEEIVERLKAVEMAAQVHNCAPTSYDGPSMEDLVELFSGLGARKKPTGNSGMTSLISV